MPEKLTIAERLETGSRSFNDLLGGGLPRGSVTDIYGASATGKTQFAFQSALFSAFDKATADETPRVVFIDCAGSFRPERIAEMAETRGFPVAKVLDRIYTIQVRSVLEQHASSERVMSTPLFDKCRLMIVDDVTTNFAAEYGSFEKKRDGDATDGVYIHRHYQLATYARKLAYLAYSKNIAVLLTNSVRSRLTNENRDPAASEKETTGDIISQYSLFRLHFKKLGSRREATVIHPFLRESRISFEIRSEGIVP